MASQIDIYNYALGNIGSSDVVATMDERSKQANVCNRFYALARDTVLADFDWPFATRYATLALVTDVIQNWAYVYQYPSDCLRLITANDRGWWSTSDITLNRHQVAQGAGGRVILSNMPAAVGTYVSRVEEVERMTPQFIEALGWKLASMIAMPLTNTRSIAETAGAMYQQAAQEAWASALNESKNWQQPASEYITARGAESGCDVYRNWGRN